MRFQNKIALITAAANGIGRATAGIMAAEGAMVIAVDNHQERLDAAVDAIAQAGGQARGVLCDALDAAQVDATVAGVVKEFGRIDILVNAVGGSTIIARPAATVDELTIGEWQKLIDFNLNGTFLFTHAVVPVMKGQKGGKIVKTPLRRVAEASDQAKVICFLASSDADFVTGLTIDVTGGL